MMFVEVKSFCVVLIKQYCAPSNLPFGFFFFLFFFLNKTHTFSLECSKVLYFGNDDRKHGRALIPSGSVRSLAKFHSWGWRVTSGIIPKSSELRE